MSEAIERTAAGATRTFLGALGFILLMVGLEGITEKAAISIGAGIVLTILGASCFYAAFFWETVKKALSQEAQEAISRFAKSRITQFGMLFLVLETLILSKFVQEHRWPFSFPADPAVFAENESLKRTVNQTAQLLANEKQFGDKWRFAGNLRQAKQRTNKVCKYSIHFAPSASGVIAFWRELFEFGGWESVEPPRPVAADTIQAGITIRISSADSPCAGALQRGLTDIFPNPPSRIANDQQTDFFSPCEECVQVEIRY